MSMSTIRACGCGERSSFMCSSPGTSTSKVYRAVPVTTSGPAGAPRDLPTACPASGLSVCLIPRTASSMAR